MTFLKTAPLELAVIIPTYNERANVLLLIDKLKTVLSGIRWEAVVVDDNSPDETWKVVLAAAQNDPGIRLIRRVGRKGLSSACIEGMLSTAAPVMAVIDADLQHDETLLPQMLGRLTHEAMDVVVGSRYIDGGGMDGWPASRVMLSRLATGFAKTVTGVLIRDPMSGFFMVRREYFETCVGRLNGRGFKILLDVLMSSPREPRFVEVAYRFRPRQHGESKLSFGVIVDYFWLVMQKGMQRAVTKR
jgi:dolichol-phosphate mannosyltransferase